ncbi:helix-turn-helix domain-containing protein [Streptomyces sp. NPDC021020]|uniref:helix-turn-helix domain-containing protein n=1 Tax=Streptomyces sp. NPDC021020 TaxID=3365109 RepID=UPI0037B66445
MSERHPTLRERRRLETRGLIQAHAVRLFTDRGYDEVTVADVAEAAGVSAMTVYRHFPTKEDLVLVDRPARIIAELVAASPPSQPLVRRVGGALVEAARALTGGDGGDGGDSREADERFLLDCLRLMVATPALRARHLDSQYALQQAIVDALGSSGSAPDPDGPDPDAADPDRGSGPEADRGSGPDPDPTADPDAAFRAQAATSACLAAMHTALTRWAEDDGRTALPDLIARALTASFGEGAVAPREDRRGG